MIGGRRNIGREAAILAALLALVLNLVVPQGYMPSASGGAPGLVLCTGAGPVSIALGADGQPIKAPASPAKGGDGPCVFAGHGAPPPLAQAPVLALARLVWRAEPAPMAITAPPSRGFAAPPPPATGPPSQAA